MYKTTHKDFACIINILDSIEKIENYSQDFSDADSFYEDTKSFDAVMMNFVVIGEMAEKLSYEFTENTGEEIEWPGIKGLRNIIAHDYFGIDAEEIWQIIHGRLNDLKISLTKIISG